jgi:serine protease Do
VAKVKPAVVQIATVSTPGQTSQDGQDNNAMPQMPDLPPQFGDMFRRYFGQPGNGGMGNGQRAQRALGSGFIIDPDGYIVTNNHVVDGARDVSVTLTDGNKYSAKVVGRDAKTDLALLKISAGKPLPYVAFGNSDNAQEGDWVIAVGNPYGLGGTVTAGIISAHGRNINAGPYDDFMQIDAPINPGNSGGPLFNQSGQVVGIDTAIYSPTGGSVGIGFAIPANVAKSVMTQLREHGQVARGWLGISMQPLTQALAKAVGLPNTDGVVVDTVEGASPASRAELQQGDVITAFNGKPIKDARDLAMAVANTASGDKASMTVWRNQASHSMTVTIGSEEKKAQVASAAGDGVAPPRPVGMSLQPLTPDMRSQLNIGPSTAGVLVARVTPGSKAEESGIQAGDIIQRVGANKVASPAEVASAIRAAEQQKKEAITLLVNRNGVTSYLGLQLA